MIRFGLFILLLNFKLSASELRETTVRLHISEDAPLHTFVGNVELERGPTYRIATNDEAFRLNLDTGQIFTRASLDRETTSVHQLLLISTLPSIVHIEIFIDDVNDNAPLFSSLSQNVTIAESAPIGSRIPLTPAVDPDSGINGKIVGYEITDGDSQEHFKIVYDPEVDNVLMLEIIKPLDHEKHPLFTLTLSANDGGLNARSSTTKLEITVLDVNDNTPQFDQSEYMVIWSGNLKDPITRLSTRDEDSGQNGVVSLVILGPATHLFTFDSTGRLFAKENWRACCASQITCVECSIPVRAIDHGNPPLSSTTSITVKLNEGKPGEQVEIRFKMYPPGVDFALVEEESRVGRTIAVVSVVSVVSPSNPFNGTLKIVNGNENGIFSLKGSPKLSLLRLERDASAVTKDQFLLTFQAISNSGNYSSKKTLQVYFQRKGSEKKQHYGPSFLSISLNEDSPIGSFVTQIKGAPGATFRIIKGGDDFEIDSVNGIMVSKKDLWLKSNRETEIDAEVETIWPPPSIHPTNTRITLKVLDVNNHSPLIQTRIENLLVSEDSPIGETLITILAKDQDLGKNAQLEYFLLTPTPVFKIEKQTGKLILLQALDYEKRKEFLLEMEICDMGKPRLCAREKLNIYVKDVNDNPPIFLWPTQFLAIPRTIEIDQKIGSVYARDLDSKTFGSITYSFIEKNEHFTIDSMNGEISLISLPKYRKELTLAIIGIDNGGLQSTNNASIFIRFLESSEKKPLFANISSRITIKESKLHSQMNIGKIEAKNAARYEKLSGPIEIDEFTGVLTLSSDLDLHINSSIPFSVLAISPDGVKESLLRMIEIDSSQKTPKFLQQKLNLSVTSQTPIGAELQKIEFDEEIAHLSFSSDCAHLWVDERTRVIRTKALFDLPLDQIQCSIKASNAQGGSDEMQLILNVDQKIEPTVKSHLRVVVEENVSMGTRIGNLSSFHSSHLIFSLDSLSKNSPIGVFPTGELFIRRLLDREENSFISLAVIASHSSKSNKSNKWRTEVEILVEDVNDNAPECEEKNGELPKFAVESTKSPGSEIGELACRDKDLGLNGYVVYELIDNIPWIALDLHGRIFLSSLIPANVSEVTVAYSVADLAHLVPNSKSTSLKSSCKFVIEIAREALEPKIVVNQQKAVSPLLFPNVNSNTAPIFEKVPKEVLIEKWDLVGKMLFQIQVTSLVPVKFNSLSPNFYVNSKGSVILNEIPERITDRFLLIEAEQINKVKHGELVERIHSRLSIPIRLADSPSDSQSLFPTCHIKENVKYLSEVWPEIETNEKITLLQKIPSDCPIENISDRLRVVAALDREKTSECQFFLKTIDDRQVIHRLLKVIVDDENDNRPICDGLRTFVVSQLPTVIPIQCHDRDSAENGTLHYSIPQIDGVRVQQDGHLIVDRLIAPLTNISITVTDMALTNPHSTIIEIKMLNLSTDFDLISDFDLDQIPILRANLSTSLGTRLGKIDLKGLNVAVSGAPDGGPFIEINEKGEMFLSKKLSSYPQSLPHIITFYTQKARKDFTLELVVDDDVLMPEKSQVFFVLNKNTPKGFRLGKLNDRECEFSTTNPFFKIHSKSGVIQLTNDLPKGNLIDFMVDLERKNGLRAQVKVNVAIVGIEHFPRNNDAQSRESFFFVPENSPFGTPVGQLAPKHSHFYSLISGHEDFVIDPKTAIIRTKRSLDREMNPIFFLSIRETNSYGYSTEKNVTVFVEDENDSIPTCVKTKFNVSEETISETIIGRIQWNDEDSDTFFNPTIVAGDEENLFAVYSNGDLKLLGELDYEKKKEHHLLIKLTDDRLPFPSHSIECQVIVQVEDINDNSPIFIKQTTFIAKETATTGEVIGLLTTMDKDSNINAQVKYRIVPETLPIAYFLVDPVFGYLSVGRHSLRLAPTDFTFQVEAIDSGNPPLLTTQIIQIKILSTCKEKFKFNDFISVFSLSETIEIGKSITQLSISDLQKCVTFTTNHERFAIDSKSGVVTVKNHLDFEQWKNETIIVLAIPLGGGPSTNATLKINVLNENDEKPHFFGGFLSNVQVYENISAILPIAISSSIGEDRRDGSMSEMTYSIISGNTSLFSIESDTGKLLLLNDLDAEINASHELIVEVKDGGSPRLSATTRVLIDVLNINDNSPQFSQNFYQATVKENDALNSLVLQVDAEDCDNEDQNLYQIIDCDECAFKINSTGALLLSESLERDGHNGKSSYNFRIRATDTGRVYKRSTDVKIEIKIEDVNDNSPTISNRRVDYFIPSIVKAGDLVFYVAADDLDENDRLRFKLFGNDADFFQINRQGLLFAKNDLPLKTEFSFGCTVVDTVGHKSSTSFTLYPTNNPNFPTFTPLSNDYIKISENVKRQITQVNASVARDSKIPIEYSIESSNERHFSIDPMGNLRTNGLDFEKERNVTVIVSGCTKESPSLCALLPIQIHLNDQNDNAPIFEKQLYTINVMENSNCRVLLTVKAVDIDDGQNSEIIYSLPDQFKHKFSIDRKSGELFLLVPLDREERKRYELTVTATDQGEPPRNGTTLVQIEILNEDDNPLRFTRLYHASIPEDSPIGSQILHIKCQDADGQTNHSFQILDNDQAPFLINEVTGIITTTQALDREKTSYYRLRVRVEDLVWSVETAVAIQILDINDNHPTFYNIPTKWIIKEQGEFGKINATDGDFGENSRIRYSLQQAPPCFYIDPLSGLLFFNCPIVFRKPVNITIRADDHGIPILSSYVTVPVFFEDQKPAALSAKSKQLIKREKRINAMPPIVLEALNSQVVHCFSWENLTLENCSHLYSIGSCIHFRENSQEMQQIECGIQFLESANEWRTTIRTISPRSWASTPEIAPMHFQNISISSRTLPGTLLPVDISKKNNSHCITNNSIIQFSDGDFILLKKLESSQTSVQIYCWNRNREIYRSSLSLNLIADAPPPVFHKKIYFFTAYLDENLPIILNRWHFYTPKNWMLTVKEIEYKKLISIDSEGTLTICGRMSEGLHRVTLEVRESLDASFVASKALLTIKILPDPLLNENSLFGWVREKLEKQTIFRLNPSKDVRSIALENPIYNTLFNLSSNNVLYLKKPVDAESRLAYFVPIVVRTMNDSKLYTARIYVDDDVEHFQQLHQMKTITIFSSRLSSQGHKSTLIDSLHPADKSLFTCTQTQFVNSNCSLIHLNENMTISVEALDELSQIKIKYSVFIVNLPQVTEKLEKAIILEGFGRKRGLALCLSMLQEKYPDMKFSWISLDYIGFDRFTLVLEVRDRLGNSLSSSDSRALLESFFKRNQEILEIFLKKLSMDECLNRCPSETRCTPTLIDQHKEHSLRFQNTIFLIPAASLEIKCLLISDLKISENRVNDLNKDLSNQILLNNDLTDLAPIQITKNDCLKNCETNKCSENEPSNCRKNLATSKGNENMSSLMWVYLGLGITSTVVISIGLVSICLYLSRKRNYAKDHTREIVSPGWWSSPVRNENRKDAKEMFQAVNKGLVYSGRTTPDSITYARAAPIDEPI